MPVSLAYAKRHVSVWQTTLSSRPWWPSHLFFAAHVTTAAKIILSGSLHCRRDLIGQIDHDIANQDALGTNPIAHNYVRLYFRPRTHFHLRTEGIKLLSDNYRLPAHMSMPIIFMFDLPSVVTRPGVAFCDRKMAHVGIQPGFDEAYFDTIDFTKVYHDAPIYDQWAKQDINDRRMAEVLVPDSLPLKGTLAAIVCRTQSDAHSLRSMIANSSWQQQVRVTTKPAEMYFCRGAYISELQLAGVALTLRVSPSTDYRRGTTLKFDIVQRRLGTSSVAWRQDYALENGPLLISGWDANFPLDWTISIEDALAFKGPIPVATMPVVGP